MQLFRHFPFDKPALPSQISPVDERQNSRHEIPTLQTKIPPMKKFLTAAVLSVAFSAASFAGVGIFGSYIGINSNGGGNSW